MSSNRRAELLSVGYELLIGRVVNTNAAFLGGDLTRRGYSVVRGVTVGDEPGEIGVCLRDSLQRNPDLIVCTGGLGPTFDDLTAEAVAKSLSLELKLNEEALVQVSDSYSRMGLPLTPERRKLAVLPAGCEVLQNAVGTAPGFALRHGHSWVVCLPGVPSEMKDIWERYAERYAPRVASFFEELFLVEGLPESAVAPLISREIEQKSFVYIKSHPKGTESSPKLEIHVYTSGSGQHTKEAVSEVADHLKRELEKMGGRIGGET